MSRAQNTSKKWDGWERWKPRPLGAATFFLAAAGSTFIVSDQKHTPAAMLLPLSTHSMQTERFARQAAASLPTRKRAWQQIVQAEQRAQARPKAG